MKFLQLLLVQTVSLTIFVSCGGGESFVPSRAMDVARTHQQCTSGQCIHRSKGLRDNWSSLRSTSDLTSSSNRRIIGASANRAERRKPQAQGESRSTLVARPHESSSNRQVSIHKQGLSTRKPNEETVLLGEDERSVSTNTRGTSAKPWRGQTGTDGNGDSDALVIGLPDSSAHTMTSTMPPRSILKKGVVTSKPNSETLLLGEQEKPSNSDATRNNPARVKTNNSGSSETKIIGLPESAVRIDSYSTTTLRPLFRANVSTERPNRETFMVGVSVAPTLRNVESHNATISNTIVTTIQSVTSTAAKIISGVSNDSTTTVSPLVSPVIMSSQASLPSSTPLPSTTAKNIMATALASSTTSVPSQYQSTTTMISHVDVTTEKSISSTVASIVKNVTSQIIDSIHSNLTTASSTTTTEAAANVTSLPAISKSSSSASSLFPEMHAKKDDIHSGMLSGFIFQFVIVILFFSTIIAAIYVIRKKHLDKLRHHLMPIYNFDPSEDGEDWETELLDGQFNTSSNINPNGGGNSANCRLKLDTGLTRGLKVHNNNQSIPKANSTASQGAYLLPNASSGLLASGDSTSSSNRHKMYTSERHPIV